VFGTSDTSELHRRYRSYASVVHPDRNPSRQREATELFTILQRLYQEATEQHAPLVIETRHNRYVTEGPSLRGDLADLYPATANGARVLLKIARDPRSDDLMQAEMDALAAIEGALAGQAVHAHFPTFVERAQIRDGAGVQRRLHVLAYEHDTVSLVQVLRAYPRGLDTPDAAWMFNRLLAALALTHAQGLVHGAVLLPHLLIQPQEHNGVLIDWCYSVSTGEPIRAISPQYRDDYPPEVLAKHAATPATDLFMAARCMVRLLGGSGELGSLPERVPKPVRALLASCLIPAPARRASDAWQLLDDFRAVLAELYGPPRFRPFAMPSFH
jgi:hypothetical protein